MDARLGRGGQRRDGVEGRAERGSEGGRQSKETEEDWEGEGSGGTVSRVELREDLKEEDKARDGGGGSSGIREGEEGREE